MYLNILHRMLGEGNVLPMDMQSNIQSLLKSKFQQLKARNPQYSTRAFAKKAGVSAGTLSLIMLGKRKASAKLARKIADKLGLDPQERSQIVAQAKPDTKTSIEFLKLSSVQFDVISEWYYFAILNLIKTKNFVNDPAWISERLALPIDTVHKALDNLKTLNLLVEENGALRRSQARYRTSDNVANAALKSSHYQNLQLAEKALDVCEIDERDFTWLTVAFDPSKMSEVKEKIRQFQDELIEIIEEGDAPSEVYRLAMQFFPITKLNKEAPHEQHN